MTYFFLSISGLDPDPPRAEDRGPEPGLLRPHRLHPEPDQAAPPARVRLPCDTAAANLHERIGTGKISNQVNNYSYTSARNFLILVPQPSTLLKHSCKVRFYNFARSFAYWPFLLAAFTR